ncbi:SdpI family protein [Labedaea rhizosphaerae]|uniref:SdpI/YhfL family protein n=1 Tax=Labedaea rhizosphaerae TaxID=598644 RepID=A0A4R6SM40_LABRH|nr:SdpI/YhfL family protein [Labedaea rhizosphaerae]
MPVVIGLLIAVVGFLGLTERLPRNRFGGVRTDATMRSDETFRVANKVAGLPLLVAGLVGVLGGVAGFFMPNAVGTLVAAVIGLVGLLAIATGGGVLGHRAAAAVPDEKPEPEVPAGCAGCQCGTCAFAKA